MILAPHSDTCHTRVQVKHLCPEPDGPGIRAYEGEIGWTANLGQRYSSLGHVSDILGWQSGTFEDEQEIHHSLVGLAVRGVEYYSPTEPRVLAIVNTMRSSLGIAALDAAA